MTPWRNGSRSHHPTYRISTLTENDLYEKVTRCVSELDVLGCLRKVLTVAVEERNHHCLQKRDLWGMNAQGMSLSVERRGSSRHEGKDAAPVLAMVEARLCPCL